MAEMRGKRPRGGDKSIAASSRRSKQPRRQKYFGCTWDKCASSFSRRNDMQRHVEAVHLKLKPYACDWSGCAARFAKQGNLNTHKATVHRRARGWKADTPEGSPVSPVIDQLACSPEIHHITVKVNLRRCLMDTEDDPLTCAPGCHTPPRSERLAEQVISQPEVATESTTRSPRYAGREAHISDAETSGIPGSFFTPNGSPRDGADNDGQGGPLDFAHPQKADKLIPGAERYGTTATFNAATKVKAKDTAAMPPPSRRATDLKPFGSGLALLAKEAPVTAAARGCWTMSRNSSFENMCSLALVLGQLKKVDSV